MCDIALAVVAVTISVVIVAVTIMMIVVTMSNFHHYLGTSRWYQRSKKRESKYSNQKFLHNNAPLLS